MSSLYTPGLLLRKLEDGDHIETGELVHLKDRLDRVVVALSGFGERYNLVLTDAAIKSGNIAGYLRARSVSE
jgi:hypothetical protein